VGLAFILFELATKHQLTRLLFNALPVTRPDSLKTLKVENGQVVSIAAFELNRNVAVMLLMLWPALLCLSRLTDRLWRSLGIAALFAATAVTIMLSEHETSKIGLVAGALIFLAAWLWPTSARRGMLVLWCLAFVLVVPLSTLLVKEQLHQAEWLPYSARSRITLWAYTADKVPEAPFFGIGLTSTRKLSADRTLPHRQEAVAHDEHEGRVLVWKTGPHSHNEFLQTWYELGAVGVILLLAAGCAVIGYIGRLSPAIRPFMLAQFAVFFVMAAFSWGMWQSWLMALTGLAALYAALAASFARADVPVADEFTHAVRSPLASGERAA
jgi:O-antigen ligase